MRQNSLQEIMATHPAEAIQLAILALCFIWHTGVAIEVLIIHAALRYNERNLNWFFAIAGMLLAACAVFFEQYLEKHNLNVIAFLGTGFAYNSQAWSYLISGQVASAAQYLIHYSMNYVLGMPLFIATLLAVIDSLSSTFYAKIFGDYQRGRVAAARIEISDQKVMRAFAQSNEKLSEMLLGISKYTGKPVTLTNSHFNHGLFVTGTIGSGKTVACRAMAEHALKQKLPLIALSGKPTEGEIKWLAHLAATHNVPFYCFNGGAFNHYNCLGSGGYTELKDKIICLKDAWESDYYKSIAEDYLQTAFEILLATKAPFDLKELANCLDYKYLLKLIRTTNDAGLVERAEHLKNYDKTDISGLQAHLHLLTHSEIGHYFDIDANTFTLKQAINEKALVYFALPALKFPSFAKILGKLVVNDIKSAIASNDSRQKVFTLFDEFSVFAGEQVLNLVNMGREQGVHAIFATQGLADLDYVGETFKNQLFNCINTIICHRVNDEVSTTDITNWIGTKHDLEVTAQINLDDKHSRLGSVKQVREFIVHPDMLKQELKTGEAFFASKVGQFQWDKIKVKYLS